MFKNSMFVGTTLSAPLILLSSYGMGDYYEPPPLFWRIARACSYLRYALVGIADAIYSPPRDDLVCPIEFCILGNVGVLRRFLGIPDASFWLNFAVLIAFLVTLHLAGYYLILQRLSPNYAFRKIKCLNSVFTGPACTVPLMLLSIYGIGSGDEVPPLVWKIARACSFLRYAVEGLVAAVYSSPREDLVCPEHLVYCDFKNADYFVNMLGMSGISFWVDLTVLIAMLLGMNLLGYYLLRQRLSPNYAFRAIKYIGRFIKAKMFTV